MFGKQSLAAISEGWMASILLTRSYFSIIHVQAAAMYARQAHAVELTGESGYFFEHRAHVIASVMCAVAFLEATINELFSDSEEPDGGHLRPLESVVIGRFKQMWEHGVPRTARYSVVEKYEIALTLADLPPIERSSSPYQDVKILTQLRNALVHYEPEWVYGGDEVETLNKLARSLKGKFGLNPLTGGGNPFYPDKALGHGCAQWAVERSVQFADDFYTRMGLPIRYEHVRSKLGTT